MTALLDLAERCEKSEGPSRELDRDIAQAVEGEVYPAWSIFNSSPYTASVDAALTLVPEGWHPSVIMRQAMDACIIGLDHREISRTDHAAFVKHLPRYVCSRALRARANA
jgi:hypothetical protein